jgi:hypothetical protein
VRASPINSYVTVHLKERLSVKKKLSYYVAAATLGALAIAANSGAQTVISNSISVAPAVVINNVTNIIGTTTISNTNFFNITNVVNAGDSINFPSSLVQNVTNIYTISVGAITVSGGVSSITGTSAVQGAVTFTGEGVQQSGSTFNFSGGGGGGGEGTLSVSNLIGAFPIIITNLNNTAYIGFQSFLGGVFYPSFSGTSVVQFVGPTQQLYYVGAETQLVVHLWGGGGASDNTALRSGGYTEVFLNVTTGEVLTVEIGEGGVFAPTSAVPGFATASAWPDGGVGVRRNNSTYAGSGAGSTRLWRGTNLIAVAGGAGGGAGAIGAGLGINGSGGGISGGNGTTAGGTAGQGGTQTQGGTTGSTAIPMYVTNSAGSFLQGGSGGATTNNATGSAGGGGGGYYGGGGGLVTTGTQTAGGGGGSGYYNQDLVIYGTTIRTDGASPAGIDQPWYGTDTGGFGWGVGRGTVRGGHGAVVIRIP